MSMISAHPALWRTMQGEDTLQAEKTGSPPGHAGILTSCVGVGNKDNFGPAPGVAMHDAGDLAVQKQEHDYGCPDEHAARQRLEIDIHISSFTQRCHRGRRPFVQ